MRAYFDHNATTPVAKSVLEAMLPAYTGVFGNASSIHGYGQEARQLLEKARRQVAGLIGSKAEEVVFTSGGTEANNLALFGLVEAGKSAHFVTSAIEHPAVLNVMEELRGLGYEVTFLPVGEGGVVDPEDVRRALRPNTRVVSLMAINNEIGSLQPVAEVASIARAAGVFVHCDAVQAPGRMKLDVREFGVDLLSLSGHKLNGPKGVGALFVKKGVPLRKRTFGGHHEKDRRPGTENVAGAVGLGAACEAVQVMDGALRDRLEAGLLARIPDAFVNGDRVRRAPNVTNLRFPGIEGESLVIALDMKGFAVSSGSACSSGSVEPSHVLLALGLSPADARSAIRFSLGISNTVEEVDALIAAVAESVARLRKLSPVYV
ncbi:MAG: cysteine desulfurase family protein [Acidobacteria bacterium]|nr:cysteine desulfurase family protein [Acidobacteriota bacterium]